MYTLVSVTWDDHLTFRGQKQKFNLLRNKTKESFLKGLKLKLTNFTWIKNILKPILNHNISHVKRDRKEK